MDAGYTYTITTFPVDERAVAAALGIDYAEIEQARADRAAMPAEMRGLLDEYDRRVDRAFLGV